MKQGYIVLWAEPTVESGPTRFHLAEHVRAESPEKALRAVRNRGDLDHYSLAAIPEQAITWDRL